jgi:sugar O-acyltransferase (sialic acid O-acetyltransferase NeuD family)
MKKAIIGSGGFGRELNSVLLDNNPNEIIDFFVEDNYIDEISKPLSSLDIEEYEVVIAIGDPVIREKIYKKLPKETKYFKAIHKSVKILDDNVEIGDGSIIFPGVILTTNIKIGKHCYLNLQTSIAHDVEIGDFFTTAAGVRIAGNCRIGDRVYLGSNSSVREKINICSDVMLGLNTGVVKDITESGVYVGTPSVKIK